MRIQGKALGSQPPPSPTMSRITLCGLAILAGATTADAFSVASPSVIGRQRGATSSPSLSGAPRLHKVASVASCSARKGDNGPVMAADGWEKAAQKAAVSCAIAVSLAVGAPMEARSELAAENKVVAEAWSVVDATYVDRTFNNNDWFKIRQDVVKRKYPSRDAAYQAIADDMLKPLGDQYTRFINPLKYEALRNSIVSGGKGQDVSGIGVTLAVDKTSKLVKIVDLAEGGPAEKAGLKRNSLFVEVNKIKSEAGSVTAEEIAALVRGPTGTNVEIKIRGSDGADKVMTIERQTVKIKPVTAGVVGKTGWIKIKQFDQQTAELVKAEVDKEQAAGVGCRVIDLRDNAGGFFRAGVDAASIFLPTGKKVVSVVNKNGLQDSFTTDKDGLDTSNPLFVLVNENTASASEIMTGALKDNKRATIVGEKTFGKGVIQTVTPLSDGSGIAVTIAKYFTPNDIDINKKGIEVDSADTKMCPDPYPGL